ncbi:MAG: tyrosine-type recombinase/integrase, partial [Lachnospirales bacterium]
MPRKRANGEGSLRKRANGKYEVRVSAGVDPRTGKYRKISKYYDTKTEAMTDLHRLHEEVRAGLHSTNCNYTFVEWLSHCLDTYMKNNIKQSTYTSYRGYIKNHISKSFASVKLRNLKPSMLQAFFNFKYEECGLSPKTLRNMNNFIHKALDKACKEGIICNNVAECVELPKSRKADIRILNLNEQRSLISESYNHRYGVFVRITLATGMRLGELLGLRWEDVSFSGNRIFIRQTLNRLFKYDIKDGENSTEIVFDTPKSENSIRSIPLIPSVVEDLQNWQRIQEKDRVLASTGYKETGLVVTNEIG